MTRPYESQKKKKKKKKKKENLLNSRFYRLADNRVKLKESVKKEKYLDLAWERKKNYETWKWQWYQL